ncbi:Septin-8-A [Hypsizygus marmoreus]|uniref:Septin-8-A n=1 Tax=Hypsizygus marmoreus TaxID=39966 RepID=A0A369JBM5_HYPMA|nr:Septin-8-A [Hypsizygus marmoreus]
MFSFRRKPKKEQDKPRIRTSPSLPELNSSGIPWPESLVDVAAIQQSDLPTEQHHQGKPKDGGLISSLYMTSPPSAFENRKSNTPTVSRYSQRRARIPPTFNVMVVGGKGTGKTSLLRLLLDTADISPTATVDQKAALDRFLRGRTKPTQSIQTACIEICESRFDRILFSVIDTPGLDFQEGRELKLERQVNGVIKYVDAQYADTMSEESKVVRKSKGDQHIHLCIYLVDPSSIVTVAERRALSSLPAKTRSETTVSYRTPPELVPDTSSADDSDDDDEPLTMSPAEIRVIRRLSARTNVLPVVARSDSLTDAKLHAVKLAVRNGLAEAGLDFGVFEPAKNSPDAIPKRQTHFATSNGNGHNSENGNGNAEPSEEEGPTDERQARPVIKLRPTRHRGLSRSRSRRDLSLAVEDDHWPVSPDSADRESVANVRFSAHIIAKTDLTELLPFALITPEGTKRRQRPLSSDSQQLETPSSPEQHSEEDTVPPTPASIRSVRLPYLHGPPDELKGVFVRKFRWGTVDVLDPNHCDFAALRTAVLSTHFKVLKTHTKEVLYEKYRTEKLLARRATRNISEEERQRLLEDLGL